MANTYLTRTSGTPTNALKWTFSCWVKMSGISEDMYILDFFTNSTNRAKIGFSNTGDFMVFEEVGSATSQSLRTNALHRDSGAWYNFVVACDRTLGTTADRTKVYINGVQQTSFSTATYPSQNVTGIINTAVSTAIGKNLNGTSYFNGLMSHVHFIDGTAYPASTFGSVDSTSGIWSINTAPSVTYGNNGFFILKDGNTITDQSGESNDFSLGGGTLTKTEDCPDNNFATLNPLIKASNQPTFTNGNTTVISPSGTNARYGGTLGMTSGKYYYEVKLLGSISNGGFGAGILNIDSFNFNTTSGISTSSNYIGVVVNSLGGTNNFYIQHGGATNDFSQTLSVGMIIGHAIDMDNGYYYVHNNGVYINSGDPTSGATGTGNINRTGNLNYDFSNLTMVVGGTSQNVDYGSFNFGNGTFGTTAVTTNSGNGYAGTDGKSIFNYQPPTGYSALSTKGLNL